MTAPDLQKQESMSLPNPKASTSCTVWASRPIQENAAVELELGDRESIR